MPTDSHLLTIRQRDWTRIKDDLPSSEEKRSWYAGVSSAAIGAAISAVIALVTSLTSDSVPTFAWILLWVVLAVGVSLAVGFGFAAKTKDESIVLRVESITRVMKDVDDYQGQGKAAPKAARQVMGRTMADLAISSGGLIPRLTPPAPPETLRVQS